MKRYDFQLENNDNNSGWYYLPDQYETPMPVMVHCHGWGGSRAISDSVRPLRKAVLAQKMAFVTFDFYSFCIFKFGISCIAQLVTTGLGGLSFYYYSCSCCFCIDIHYLGFRR